MARSRGSTSMCRWCRTVPWAARPWRDESRRRCDRTCKRPAPEILASPAGRVGLGDDAVTRSSLGRRIIHAERDAQDVGRIGLQHNGFAAAGEDEALRDILGSAAAPLRRRDAETAARMAEYGFMRNSVDAMKRMGICWRTECKPFELRGSTVVPLGGCGTGYANRYDKLVTRTNLSWQSKLVLLLVLPWTAVEVALLAQDWFAADARVAAWVVGLSAALGVLAWTARTATPAAAATGAVLTASLMFSTAGEPFAAWHTALSSGSGSSGDHLGSHSLWPRAQRAPGHGRDAPWPRGRAGGRQPGHRRAGGHSNCPDGDGRWPGASLLSHAAAVYSSAGGAGGSCRGHNLIGDRAGPWRLAGDADHAAQGERNGWRVSLRELAGDGGGI